MHPMRQRAVEPISLRHNIVLLKIRQTAVETQNSLFTEKREFLFLDIRRKICYNKTNHAKC